MASVKIADLFPREPCVSELGVTTVKKYFNKHGKFEKGNPKVVKVKGCLMVFHGHHRVTSAKELGQTDIIVDIIATPHQGIGELEMTLEIRKGKNQKGFENYPKGDASQRSMMTTQEAQDYRLNIMAKSIQDSMNKSAE